MNQDIAWEDLYQQGDTGWDRGEMSPALTHWLESGLNKEQRILIPGCGRGYEVIELARLGFDVTALDIAPSAIESLKNSLKQEGLHATLICGDLFDYQTTTPFDAVYEQTCLCALPLELRSAYASHIKAWLKPQGSFYFSMMQTGEKEGPPFHCDWADMQCLFGAEDWLWQQKPPLLIARPKGKRFELAFRLIRR